MASGTIKTNSWKFIGQVGGGNTLDLPSEYEELYVSAIYNTGSYWRGYDWIFPAMVTNNIEHTQGYGFNNKNNYCSVRIFENDKIRITSFTENGVDVIGSAVLTAYYR